VIEEPVIVPPNVAAVVVMLVAVGEVHVGAVSGVVVVKLTSDP
jgi:hypothetical protein